MSHQELIALKLQMGICPSSEIAPSVLMAMWQQLRIESRQTPRPRSRVLSSRKPVTSTCIDL